MSWRSEYLSSLEPRPQRKRVPWAHVALYAVGAALVVDTLHVVVTGGFLLPEGMTIVISSALIGNAVYEWRSRHGHEK